MEPAIFQKLIRSLIVIAVISGLAWVVIRLTNRYVSDLRRRYNSRKAAIFLAFVLAILVVARVWVEEFASVTVILSVASAGVALALHEVILCFAAWLMITVRKMYEPGDRVELGNLKGDVIDIGVFHTSLLEVGNWVWGEQSTGRMVQAPNSAIFRGPVHNYTKGFGIIWNEIRVVVTFESDWQRAKEIMETHARRGAEEIGEEAGQLIKKMAGRYYIHYEKLTPIVYVNIVESGVELTLRYLTHVQERRATQDALCKAILEDFQKEKRIDFAYPTYRIFKRGEEA